MTKLIYLIMICLTITIYKDFTGGTVIRDNATGQQIRCYRSFTGTTICQ